MDRIDQHGLISFASTVLRALCTSQLTAQELRGGIQCRQLKALLTVCNNCLADSPHGAGGQSARHRPDIYLDGCGIRLSFLSSSSSLRPEPSGASARAVVALSIDLPPPVTNPRFLAREPSSAPPPPSQTPSPASPRPESPNPHGHHWRCLKLAPPSIRLFDRPPLEPNAGMDSW